MDKSCHSSADSITTTSSFNANNINNRDLYLKQLNKLSHKISKPSSTTANAPPFVKKPSLDYTQNITQALPPQSSQPRPQNPNQSSLQTQQHHPPVYNINKNDFRDVVQKLTGSPAHKQFSTTPPPIHQPKPQSSRLQRIRPPPLAQVRNRPPPIINYAVPNMNPLGCSQPSPPSDGPNSNSFIQRPIAAAPLSPLPPFPAVHAATESPVSAYKRYLQSFMYATIDTNPKQFSGFPPLAPLVSPRWNNLTSHHHHQQQPPLRLPPQQPHKQQQQQPQHVSSTGVVQSQSSPLPFGCLNSPRSPYALLSPSLLFSPNLG